jgi:Ser/Thr protein kinase RdoA (MazF antagonist)
LLGSVVAVGHLWLSRSEPDVQPTTSQLRRLVRAALEQQGVPVGRLRWLGEHSNHLFRCDTTSGDRLVVRVCLPDGRSDAELDSELAWLDALARDTDLTVPAARFSTRVALPDLPAGGRCIAFQWVEGRHCEQHPSRRLVADLHLGNVLDHHGQARPLDFDDAAWGHYALDLAISLDSVPEPLHPVLLDGYRAVRPLPDGYQEHTAALLAGRRLFLATFLLANQLPAAAHLDLLRAYTRS